MKPPNLPKTSGNKTSILDLDHWSIECCFSESVPIFHYKTHIHTYLYVLFLSEFHQKVQVFMPTLSIHIIGKGTEHLEQSCWHLWCWKTITFVVLLFEARPVRLPCLWPNQTEKEDLKPQGNLWGKALVANVNPPNIINKTLLRDYTFSWIMVTNTVYKALYISIEQRERKSLKWYSIKCWLVHDGILNSWLIIIPTKVGSLLPKIHQITRVWSLLNWIEKQRFPL